MRPRSSPPNPLPPGLRDAGPADGAALLDLWVAAWRVAVPEIDFEARRGWLARHLADLAAAGCRILVAEVAGVVAGFVTVDPRRRHLDQLAVHPVHQGGGVADRLMEGARALSPAGLALEVNEDNGRARRFYARHGFETVGTGRNPNSGRPTLLLHWRGGPEVPDPGPRC